jgi:DNA-binding CsgD family transcriptional regulator
MMEKAPALSEPIEDERPPHPQSDLFNSFLQNFQEDIKRIIGKFRYSSHHLEPAEIASRANLSLLKKREDILYSYEGEFDEIAFKKLSYKYVKNIIGWSHYREDKDKYRKNRSDGTYLTEDGPKTSFDIAIEMEGEEDPSFEAFDSNGKYTVLLHVIKEYCHILTDGELKILSCLEIGMTHEEISKKFQFTRQAVSCSAIKLFEKIKAHFSSDVLGDETSFKVSEGNEAIHSFFSPSCGFLRIMEEDKGSLKKFLLSNAKLYNCKEISKKFLNGKYEAHQITTFSFKNKLSFCVVKIGVKNRFSDKETKRIADLYNKGRTTNEIADLLSLKPNVISGKKGHLSRHGLI